MENKKVKNATSVVFEGIKFKSKLEKDCYVRFKDAGLILQYEPIKFTLWKGFKSENPIRFWILKKPNQEKKFQQHTKAIVDITYTPDFYIKYKDFEVLIEVKGRPNDVYPYKRKMFLKRLKEIEETSDRRFLFFEVKNRSNMDDTIRYLKNL